MKKEKEKDSFKVLVGVVMVISIITLLYAVYNLIWR